MELIEAAVECGMEDPWAILMLSPREIEWRFRALAQRRRMQDEKIDLMAFLIGRYASIGFHAPKKYPRKPDALAYPPKEMTANQMKRFFAALSAGREAKNGDCRNP